MPILNKNALSVSPATFIKYKIGKHKQIPHFDLKILTPKKIDPINESKFLHKKRFQAIKIIYVTAASTASLKCMNPLKDLNVLIPPIKSFSDNEQSKIPPISDSNLNHILIK